MNFGKARVGRAIPMSRRGGGIPTQSNCSIHYKPGRKKAGGYFWKRNKLHFFQLEKKWLLGAWLKHTQRDCIRILIVLSSIRKSYILILGFKFIGQLSFECSSRPPPPRNKPHLAALDAMVTTEPRYLVQYQIRPDILRQVGLGKNHLAKTKPQKTQGCLGIITYYYHAWGVIYGAGSYMVCRGSYKRSSRRSLWCTNSRSTQLWMVL